MKYFYIVYQRATSRSFASLKSRPIVSKLIFSASFLSNYKTIESFKSMSSILFYNLVLIRLIVENDFSIVAIEFGRVSMKLATRYIRLKFVTLLVFINQ